MPGDFYAFRETRCTAKKQGHPSGWPCVILCLVVLIRAELRQRQAGVFLLRPADAPLIVENEQVVAAEVLHPLRIRGEVERRGVGALARDPADIGIRQVAAADVDVVLVLEAILQHLELQHADRTDDDLLHAGVRSPMEKMPGSNTPMMSPA